MGSSKLRFAHHELGACCFVAIQMRGDHGPDHLALSISNGNHVDRRGMSQAPEFARVVNKICNFGAPDFVLAGETVDVGAGAPNPAPFDDGGLLAGLGQMPGKVFPTLATTDDDIFIVLRAHGEIPFNDE